MLSDDSFCPAQPAFHLSYAGNNSVFKKSHGSLRINGTLNLSTFHEVIHCLQNASDPKPKFFFLFFRPCPHKHTVFLPIVYHYLWKFAVHVQLWRPHHQFNQQPKNRLAKQRSRRKVKHLRKRKRRKYYWTFWWRRKKNMITIWLTRKCIFCASLRCKLVVKWH